MIGMSFFNLHLIFYFLYYYEAHEGPQQPTTAKAGQRKSTQAHNGQRRPMQGQRQPTQANEGHSAAIDDRYVFSLIYILFFIFLLLRSPRRPTAANEGQCRPMKTKKGSTLASICPPPPPTSHNDSLVVSSASACPPPPPTSRDDSLVVSLTSICLPPPPTSCYNFLTSPHSLCPFLFYYSLSPPVEPPFSIFIFSIRT